MSAKAASKSASSLSSVASVSLSKSAASASKAAASMAKQASLSGSSVSSSASSAAASVSATAVAAAKDAYRQTSTTSIVLLTITITTTVIAGILAAIYYSGYADDILKALAKKYYEGKAQAEALALANTGSERAQGFLKDQLKKNPMMGEDELEQVSSGLGKEASMEGLGGVSSKLGGLGKL